MTIERKPILHGRDHVVGGPDEIPGIGGGGGGHEIQDEGTPLTDRAALNFVGASVAATDDAGNDATVVTISALSGGVGWAQFGHRLGTTENRYYCPGMVDNSALATATLSANVLDALPFVPSRDMTIDQIGIQVTALISGSTVRLGLYTDDGNLYPASNLLDTGTVSTATTGYKTFSVSEPLDAGELYWAVVVNSHASQQLRAMTGAQTMPILGISQPVGTPAPDQANGWRLTGVSPTSALPNPFTGGAALRTNTDGNMICIFMRGT